tara:strand:+ start:15968 stop:17845 length:1878 start_codon:yes stop_codon:yes gene_type:complete
MQVKTTQASSGLPVIYVTDVQPADVAALRSIYGMAKHAKQNIWFAPGYLPFGLYVLEDMREYANIVNFEISPEVIQLEKDLLLSLDKISRRDLNGFVPKIKPYDHQVESLSLAINMPRLGLFLDPGLGKTKIGCDLIMYSRIHRPNCFWLIVALKVNQFTWKKEMDFHSQSEYNLEPIVATGKAREKKIKAALENPKTVGIVVTYDTCRVAKDQLKALVDYTDIILDESHSVRSPKSGRTKSILELVEAKPVTRRVLLSGTPSLGSPMHLWGQLKALGDFVVPGSWQFQNRYAIRSSFNKHIITGWKNLDEVNDLVTSMSIRKTAEECLDLPDRTIQVIEVNPCAKMRRLYNATIALNTIKVGEVTLGEAPNHLTAMTRLAQLSMGFCYKSLKDPLICDSCPNLVKCVDAGIQPYTGDCAVEQRDPGRLVGELGSTVILDSVMELVESHLASGTKKLIVWGKHQWVIQQLVEKCSKLTKTLRYDSTTKNHSEVEDDFNLSDKAIIVAQISMGIGVTFKAPTMIYAEVSWSLDHWLQSLDRNYGIRAKGFKKLLVQVVVIKNSVNHSIMKLLESKINVSSLMSKSFECVSCPHALECLENNIKPFDKECVVGNSDVSKTSLNVVRL